MMSRTSSPTTMSPDQTHQLTLTSPTHCGLDSTMGSSEASPMNADADGRDGSPQDERCRSPDCIGGGGRNCNDYFRPLKKLRMVEREQKEAAALLAMNGPVASGVAAASAASRPAGGGSKPPTSFSIRDILSPKPPVVLVASKKSSSSSSQPQPQPHQPPPVPQPPTSNNELHVRIVRPWDLGDEDRSLQRTSTNTGGFRFRNSSNGGGPLDVEVDEDCCDEDEDIEVDGDDFELDNDSRASLESPDDRKGGGGRARRCGGPTPSIASANKNDSPLDALFQMTSKAFEGLNNGHNSSADPSRDHLHIFSSRPTAKKKRKSRTAFTNHQIFELEKRFLYQKYLSPADRDEIAQSLGLTNAQVITWFQNRRAKLKRDMEELKKDVDSSKTVHVHVHSGSGGGNNNNGGGGVVHLHHPRPAHPHAHPQPHPRLAHGVQDLSLMKPEVESSTIA